MEYEEALISSLLIDPESVKQIDGFKSEYIQNYNFKKIFVAFVKVLKQGKIPDLILMKEYLDEDTQMLACELMANDVIPFNIREYAEKIIEEYKIKILELLGKDLTNGLDVVNKINEVKEISLKQKHKEKELKNNYIWNTEGLNLKFPIIKRNKATMIYGDSYSGKTTFCFDMAVKNGNIGHKILFVSLEMETSDIYFDIARRYSGITIEEERDKKIPESKQFAFNNKIKYLKEQTNLFIEGAIIGNDLTFSQIEKIIDKYNDIDLIFIDNFDLIRSERNETEMDRNANVSKRIVNFTRTRKIPIIVIHHIRKIIKETTQCVVARK